MKPMKLISTQHSKSGFLGLYGKQLHGLHELHGSPWNTDEHRDRVGDVPLAPQAWGRIASKKDGACDASLNFANARVLTRLKSLARLNIRPNEKKHGPDLRVQACRTTREVH